MIKYRAIRKPYESVWYIECFDTENQVSYLLTDIFVSKTVANHFINTHFINNIVDSGEFGEWINGSI